jgi:16S rRNA (cytidine1402-2'-O)-methyltransferase
MPAGTLFLIGSPIGNLGDLTFRAVEILKKVALVAAEDTRRSSVLLRHYEISQSLISFHQHNEARRTGELIEKLYAGLSVALLTDAGMPSISDPGYRLVRASIENRIRVEVIPGPSALLTALVGSGLPTDRFYFGGFLPSKSGQRQKELDAALSRQFTSIYFESPHRILRSLEIINSMAPDRIICLARELTKHFEEYQRGTASTVLAHYQTRPPKGEITLVIGGSKTQDLHGPASGDDDSGAE